MCHFDLFADWLWAALGEEATFRSWLFFFSPGVNKPDFDPSLLQIFYQALCCHVGLLSLGEAGKSSTQLGDRPFFFKEDKEAAEKSGFLPPTCHTYVLSERCLFEDAWAPGRAVVGTCRR